MFNSHQNMFNINVVSRYKQIIQRVDHSVKIMKYIWIKQKDDFKTFSLSSFYIRKRIWLELSMLCKGLSNAWRLDHRGRLNLCPWPSFMLPIFVNWWLWVSTIKVVLARNKKYVLSEDKVQSCCFRLYIIISKHSWKWKKNYNLLLFFNGKIGCSI